MRASKADVDADFQEIVLLPLDSVRCHHNIHQQTRMDVQIDKSKHLDADPRNQLFLRSGSKKFILYGEYVILVYYIPTMPVIQNVI